MGPFLARNILGNYKCQKYQRHAVNGAISGTIAASLISFRFDAIALNEQITQANSNSAHTTINGMPTSKSRSPTGSGTLVCVRLEKIKGNTKNVPLKRYATTKAKTAFCSRFVSPFNSSFCFFISLPDSFPRIIIETNGAQEAPHWDKTEFSWFQRTRRVITIIGFLFL